jgi:hypothetical protein
LAEADRRPWFLGDSPRATSRFWSSYGDIIDRLGDESKAHVTFYIRVGMTHPVRTLVRIRVAIKTYCRRTAEGKQRVADFAMTG